MKYSRTLAWLFAASLLWGLAQAAVAKEDVEEFLEKLQVLGYGEVTLDYLDYLKQRDLLPEDLSGNWDLYQARGWRMAIGEAFNQKEIDERTTKAKKFLDKYLADHPDSLEVGSEVAEWGDISFKRGVRLLGQSRLAKDDKKATLNSEARAAFDEARPRFTQSIELHSKRIAALQAAAVAAAPAANARGRAAKPKNAAIEDAELERAVAKLKLAKVDFFASQTYTDDETEPGKAARADLLKKAVAQFSEIYQRYRTEVIGLLAHTFEGKSHEELGNVGAAQDMYDEVLALMPDDTKQKIDGAQENMFAQVEYFSLMITLKKDGVKGFLPPAAEWLKTYEKWKRTDGYQGIALEVAKAYLDQLEKTPADKKSKLRREVETMLKDMQKIPGEHHQAAAALLKDMQKKAGGGVATTYQAAINDGDDAFDAQKWDEALLCYKNATTLLTEKSGLGKAKKKEVAATIREKVESCRYNKIYVLYAAGKEDETLEQIDSLLKQLKPKSEFAGKLAALRVHIILRRYASAREPAAKEALLTELTTAAEKVIQDWPDKASADDARIALGQASMVQGKTAEAVEQFESVNPRSERYATSLYMAAQGRLRIWNAEKQKSPQDRAAKLMKQELEKAIGNLESSVRLQAKAAPAGQLPPALIEAQLVLGQVYLEAAEPQKSADLLQPVVDHIQASKPQKLDSTMLKVFNTTVRAYVAVGDMTKGGDVATLLTDLGEDATEVNTVLVTFAKMLAAEHKQASATLIEAKAESDLTAKAAAEARLSGTKELLAKLLDRLAPRKNNAPRDMIAIGDMATDIGQIDLASEIYNRILTEAANNPAFAAQVKNGTVRVRAQLVELLKQKGQFEEGLKQVNALLEEVPKALEPQMTKGRILQAWAEKDPSKFPEAVSHWANLRQKIEPATRKPGARDILASYYEINYNVAVCLLREAEKTSNPQKAIDAQKVLNALLISSPKLDGPEMVAKYRDLLKQSDNFVKKGQKGGAGEPAKNAAAKR